MCLLKRAFDRTGVPSTGSTHGNIIRLTGHHKLYFEVLQIRIISNTRELKSAYKKTSRKYNPDTYNIRKGFSKKESEVKIKIIANAYQDIYLLKEIN